MLSVAFCNMPSVGEKLIFKINRVCVKCIHMYGPINKLCKCLSPPPPPPPKSCQSWCSSAAEVQGLVTRVNHEESGRRPAKPLLNLLNSPLRKGTVWVSILLEKHIMGLFQAGGGLWISFWSWTDIQCYTCLLKCTRVTQIATVAGLVGPWLTTAATRVISMTQLLTKVE